MAKLGRYELFKVSLEAEKGTAVPGATPLWLMDGEIKREDNFTQEPAFGSGGQSIGIPGPAVGAFGGKCYVRGTGAGALDPGIAAILQACGLKLAVSTYSPATKDSEQKTVTIDRWADGVKRRLTGAALDWELSGEFGKPTLLTFSGKGKYSVEADEAVPAATQPTRLPLRMASCTLTVGGVSVKVSRLSIKANNPVEAREDITATAGVGYYFIGTNRRYILGIDPEVEASATWSPEALHEAGTTGALVWTLSDADDTIVISAPALQMLPMGLGLRDSKLIYDLQAQACVTTADNEISMSVAETA